MKDTGIHMEIHQEIIDKLSAGKGSIWIAAHNDGSDNKINEDAILDTASYSIFLAVLSTIGQSLRKMFRNKKKSHEELAAEKEAAMINRTVGALEEMMLEYIQPATKGSVDEEALDELTDTMGEIRGYYQAGKLKITDQNAMAEIRKSIMKFTNAMAEAKHVAIPAEPDRAGKDEFCVIMKQLAMQKELIYR